MIFDFGGVIIPIDFEAPIRAFKKLGIELEGEFSFLKQDPIFDRFDRGEASSKEVLGFFRSKLPAKSNATDADLLHAWNEILGVMPKARIELLERLQKKYRLFMLSNTNPLHIQCIRDHDPLMPRMEACFEKLYFSYEIGHRKPEEKSFLTITEEQGIEAQDTLFIDDHPLNISAAQKLGFQVLHCRSELTDLMKKY